VCTRQVFDRFLIGAALNKNLRLNMGNGHPNMDQVVGQASATYQLLAEQAEAQPALAAN
jgi:hypothetical protein